MVDAGQGVEAQTLANCYTAVEMDLEVVPVLNKMTCRQREVLERVAEEIEDIVGIDATSGALFSENRRWRAGRSRTSGARHSAAGRRSEAWLTWFDNYLGVVSLSVLNRSE